MLIKRVLRNCNTHELNDKSRAGKNDKNQTKEKT